MTNHPPITFRHPTFVFLLVLTAIGCGPDRPHTVPVSGVVTIDGQRPPAPGTIYFTPVEAAEGSSMRPAMGHFDAAGRYEAQTFEPGDGLLPGRYRIAVHCWATPPNMDGIPVVSYIDARYESAASSDLEELVIETKAGSIEFDLNLDGY